MTYIFGSLTHFKNRNKKDKIYIMALLKFEYKNYLDKFFQSLVYLFLQVG